MVNKKWTASHKLVAIAVAVLLLGGTAQLVLAELESSPSATPIGPRALHLPGTLVYPIGPISQVDVQAVTFDAWAAYNTINVTLTMHLGTITPGSKVYLVIEETSFDSSVLNTSADILNFITLAAIDGVLDNFSSSQMHSGAVLPKEYAISAPAAGNFTYVAITVPPSGPAILAFTHQTVLPIGPYSEYTQTVANRLTVEIANNSQAQKKSGDVMEALTWIVLGSAFLTILVDMRRRT